MRISNARLETAQDSSFFLKIDCVPHGMVVHVVKQCFSHSDVRITRMIYSRESISTNSSSRCRRCEPFLSSVTKKLQLLWISTRSMYSASVVYFRVWIKITSDGFGSWGTSRLNASPSTPESIFLSQSPSFATDFKAFCSYNPSHEIQIRNPGTSLLSTKESESLGIATSP